MLINKLLTNINNNEAVRQSLIDLKNAIKDEKQKKALAYQLAGDFSVFTELLSHEDPKVRKNAVLILGEMECDDLCNDLWEAYLKEETLFVKADYLKSLSCCECEELLPQFKKRMQILLDSETAKEEDKHIRAEITALQKLIHRYEKKAGHVFTGYDQEQTVILMTNRNHREATASQCEEEVKYLAGGLRIKTERLKEILDIRTYTELLFPIPGVGILEVNTEGRTEEKAEQLAKMISKKIASYLNVNHSGKGPFFFRMELKGITDRDQKNSMIKKLAAQIEKESDRELLNSASDYEIEIRLILNKKGQYVALLKLFTIPDLRFDYRKETLPTSIAPVNAALIMNLAKDYLKEDAQVLDPFCGTGTMLIERYKLGKCSSVYGLDILEEAIEKARKNTEKTHLPIHYINRDYFDFKHDYPFDEIITNMPSVTKTKGKDDIEYLYQRFFEKSQEVLKDHATLVVYTTVPEIFQSVIKDYRQFTIQNEYVLNEREVSICYILRYRKSK